MKHNAKRSFLVWLGIMSFAGVAVVGCGGGSDSYDSPPAPPPPPAAVLVTKTAALSGDQENPPVLTGANGTGTLTLDRTSKTITGSITLDGLTADKAHIHTGAAGSNGPVAVELTAGANNTWVVPANTKLTDVQIAEFDAGRLYFNAHSPANPSGEIRGQIGRLVFAAQLTGSQETTPVVSSALGVGSIVLDPETKTIEGGFTLTGLAATRAHIHLGAFGANGAVQIEMAQTAAGSGKWAVAPNTVLTDAQLAALRAGELYFNAHSAANPNGEVRGQIGRIIRFASLSGAQEVPANTSAGQGQGFISVDPVTRSAAAQVKASGFTSTRAHIHQAAAGANGPVAIELGQSPANADIWTTAPSTKLTADQLKALLQGGMYFNVHSAAFAAGEIRGQIGANF